MSSELSKSVARFLGLKKTCPSTSKIISCQPMTAPVGRRFRVRWSIEQNAEIYQLMRDNGTIHCIDGR